MIGLHNIGQLINKHVSTLIAGNHLNTAQVIAHWRENDPGAAVPDPLLLSHATATPPLERSYTFGAFVHYVEHATTHYVAFKEIQGGDVILDFPVDTMSFDDKDNLRFEIAGIFYVPKTVGKELSRAWDTLINNRQAGMSTMLLSVQP